MKSLTTTEQRRNVIRGYLNRRQLYPFQIDAKPDAELGLVVVIPCHDEPDIGSVLESLALCEPPRESVEVIFMINAPSGATRRIRDNNHKAESSIAAFAATESPGWLKIHACVNNELPPNDAGVGLARKLGMDEATSRIGASRNSWGVIASLDADCRVSPNYLAEISREFAEHHRCPGVSIYFEHETMPGTDTMRAIIEYELHLRYCTAGQRFAGFPYAFHTVGSSMACRADVYAAQGGMNKRQGGEDFYFAQKLIALGGYRSLTSTCVYPAARESGRVPFGTGPALQRAAAGEPQLTFAPAVFADLAGACNAINSNDENSLRDAILAVSGRMSGFLADQDFDSAFGEICANVNSEAALRRRVYRWFNAFRFMKFAQYASRCDCPKVPVVEAATELARKHGLLGSASIPESEDLLSVYRSHDRLAAGPGAEF